MRVKIESPLYYILIMENKSSTVILNGTKHKCANVRKLENIMRPAIEIALIVPTSDYQKLAFQCNTVNPDTMVRLIAMIGYFFPRSKITQAPYGKVTHIHVDIRAKFSDHEQRIDNLILFAHKKHKELCCLIDHLPVYVDEPLQNSTYTIQALNHILDHQEEARCHNWMLVTDMRDASYEKYIARFPEGTHKVYNTIIPSGIRSIHTLPKTVSKYVYLVDTGN